MTSAAGVFLSVVCIYMSTDKHFDKSINTFIPRKQNVLQPTAYRSRNGRSNLSCSYMNSSVYLSKNEITIVKKLNNVDAGDYS
jgi:hypothetical protein